MFILCQQTARNTQKHIFSKQNAPRVSKQDVFFRAHAHSQKKCS